MRIIKILAESGIPLSLRGVERRSDRIQGRRQLDDVFSRAPSILSEGCRGFAYDVVNAVLVAGADDVRDAIARAEALTAVRESEDFAAISAAFKRIKKFCDKRKKRDLPFGAPGCTLSPEAQQLADAAAALAPKVALRRARRRYGEALALIATLRPVVDVFFDKVMVLDPDPAVRGANLALIDRVLRGFSGIADFSEIVTS